MLSSNSQINTINETIWNEWTYEENINNENKNENENENFNKLAQTKLSVQNFHYKYFSYYILTLKRDNRSRK